MPYDHLLGIKKVYAENVTVDDATHILEAQGRGILLSDCILNILSICAILLHSSRLKRQKSYDILRFMREPKIYNDTIGFGHNHARMLQHSINQDDVGNSDIDNEEIAQKRNQKYLQMSQHARSYSNTITELHTLQHDENIILNNRSKLCKYKSDAVSKCSL